MSNRSSFCIETALGPADVAARIRAATRGDIQRELQATSAVTQGEQHGLSPATFAGAVGDVSFQIQWINPTDGTATGQPVLEGQIWAHGSGTRLIGNLRTQSGAKVTSPGARFFLVPLLVAAIAIRFVWGRHPLSGSRSFFGWIPPNLPMAIPVGVFALGLVAIVWVRWSSPRGAREALATLVDGVVVK